MAQEPQVLRRIDWQECFAFTRLFSGFRLALHSTKILLALAGLVCTFALGFVLDAIWVSAGHGVWPGEVYEYYLSQKDWDVHRDRIAQQRRDQLAGMLVSLGLRDSRDKAEAFARVNPAEAVAECVAQVNKRYQQRIERADAAAKKQRGEAEKIKEPDKREAALARAEEARSRTYESALELKVTQLETLSRLKPVGPFSEWIRFKFHCLKECVFAAAQGRFLPGLDAVLAGQAVNDSIGVLAWLVVMWWGFMWLVGEHWFFALILIPGLLAIWSFAGGGICRAAVMQVAKDERIGLREALRFSKEKFWGFFFAPVVSGLFIAVIAVMLVLGGLVGNIPWLGDMLAGLLWFLAILGGLAIAFIAIGAVAGGSLFVPVIAAEGSDAFDAISRAFVYVYSRPWKAVLYAGVLAVYGSLCYLFVRFFAWLMLAVTHVFVGIGMFSSRPQAGSGLSKLDLVWQMPTFTDFRPHWLDYSLLSSSEVVLAVLVGLWTYLVWAFVQSWLISFYFSGSSVAYLLLRKDVDAIDIEEVYVEEAEEPGPIAPEPAAPAPEAAEAEQPAAAEAPAPPAEKPQESAPSQQPEEQPPSEEQGEQPKKDE